MADEVAYVNNAVNRYASLFTLPSHFSLLFVFITVNTLSCMLLFFLFFPTLQAAVIGFFYGLLVLVSPGLVGDLLIKKLVIKQDVILTLRRCNALSLASSIFWIASLIIGGAIHTIFPNVQIFIEASLLGLSSTTALRFLVFNSVSLLKPAETLVPSIIQPIFHFVLGLMFFDTDYVSSQLCAFSINFSKLLPIAFVAAFLIIMMTHYYLYLIEQHGKKAVGIGSITLLKSFLVNWTEDSSSFIESNFEKLGTYTTIPITLIAFNNEETNKGIMVISSFHPGPFKNVGSSNLPYLIQSYLENKFTDSIVGVPHGTSGHENNLTSKLQCEKIIREIDRMTTLFDFTAKATKLYRGTAGSATSTCQFFGDLGLVTVTCSPENMEDIPFETGLKIIKKGKKLGAKQITVIDAHNSIDSSQNTPVLSEKTLNDIQKAAESAIDYALKGEKAFFEMAAAKAPPLKWGLKQGFGPGGIVVFLFKVKNQLVSYIVIDGNNLTTGVREKILNSIKKFGISDGEVLTTDSHAVNAIGLVKRGYNPVGQVVDHDELISIILKTTLEALSNLKRSKSSYGIGSVQKVKILGREALERLSLLVDSAFQRAKTYALIIFPMGFISVLLLLLI